MNTFSIITLGAMLFTSNHMVTAFEPNKPVIRKEQGRALQGTMIEHDHNYNKASITGIHPSFLPNKERSKLEEVSQSTTMTCSEYWFDQRIHSLGNTGPTGALHAAMAIGITKLIDFMAYDGVNVRQQVCTVHWMEWRKRKKKKWSL